MAKSFFVTESFSRWLASFCSSSEYFICFLVFYLKCLQ
jgi:hypothetical protein